jgi:hypothetical protein
MMFLITPHSKREGNRQLVISGVVNSHLGIAGAALLLQRAFRSRSGLRTGSGEHKYDDRHAMERIALHGYR